MRCPLCGKRTVLGGSALLRRPEPLKALLDDGRVLAMVVAVHLHIAGADVHLVAVRLHAVVVRLPPIVRTSDAELHATVVGRAEAQEAVLQTLRAFLVPLQMADDLLLFGQHFAGAVGAMVVVTLGVRCAAGLTAVQVAGVLGEVRRRVHCGEEQKRFGLLVYVKTVNISGFLDLQHLVNLTAQCALKLKLLSIMLYIHGHLIFNR